MCNIILNRWQIYLEWTTSNKNQLQQHACCIYSAKVDVLKIVFCNFVVVIFSLCGFSNNQVRKFRIAMYTVFTYLQ